MTIAEYMRTRIKLEQGFLGQPSKDNTKISAAINNIQFSNSNKKTDRSDLLSSKSEKFRLNCSAVGRSRTRFTSGPDYPDLWLKISRGVTRLILHYSLNWFHPWWWRTHALKLVLYIVQVHCNACLIWWRLRSFIKEFHISMVCSNINTGVSGKYSNKHVYTRQLNLKQEA